jgi:N,N'-diacetyllegionaminate synthase
MHIGPIDLDHRVLLIAEIGNNHEGSYSLAEDLIGEAAKAGASAVKFQTIVPAKLIAAKDTARREQLEKFCLSYEEFEKLSQVATSENILFMSTPFDIESAKFLEQHVPAFKIASSDNNFWPLIDTIAKSGKPIIASTGLLNLAGCIKLKEYIQAAWQLDDIDPGLSLLHCVTQYPTPPEAANLGAISHIAALGVTPGYSDHTLGIDAAALSVALGARIVEKHFTISKEHSDFRDHQLSADPQELRLLADRITEIEGLLGTGIKRPNESEIDVEPALRRSIVANRDLPRDHILTQADFEWVRQGGGEETGCEDKLIGKPLVRALQSGAPITLGDVA